MQLVAALHGSSVSEHRERLCALQQARVRVRASAHVAHHDRSTQAGLTLLLIAVVAVRSQAFLLDLLDGNQLTLPVNLRLKFILREVLLLIPVFLRL